MAATPRAGEVRYIGMVAVLALAVLALLYVQAPRVNAASVAAISMLATLAIVAEALAYVLPRSTRGSIAYIPYLSMALIAPNWCAGAAVLLVKSVTEFVSHVPRHKALFNAAQHLLSLCLVILIYRALGGTSLLAIDPRTLVHTTAAVGAPAMIATTAGYLVNSVLVSIVLAIRDSRPLGAIWREIKGPTMGLDLLAGPIIFLFAWVYAAFGPIAAAAAWIPILGLRQAHKTNLELEQTNQELLELMVKSLEARDPYTSGHSRRVRDYSTTIARAMDLPPRDVEHVARAALLHDVGKIHEKYAPILSKTDKLTADEWRVMREHPTDGANLVSTMTKLRDVVPAIRHHHENWDGTGYPDGMAGELIPLSARIIRFADTIDAMVSERPYRRPMTEAEVRAEIVKCRGTQFDPGITDRLLSSALWRNLFEGPARSTTPTGQILELVSSMSRDSELHALQESRTAPDRVTAK